MATLLETWRSLAYGDGLDDKKKEELWTNYFTRRSFPTRQKLLRVLYKNLLRSMAQKFSL